MLGVTRFELLALMLAVSFVLIAEMINTALEKAIDVATNSFDPLARAAKDVAAGAVLVAAVNAALRRLPGLRRPPARSQPAVRSTRVRDSPVHLTVIAVAVVIMLVIALQGLLRARARRCAAACRPATRPWRSAAGRRSRSSPASYEHEVLVSTLAFVMALLVAQTRVESGIHTTWEVVFGGCWERW